MFSSLAFSSLGWMVLKAPDKSEKMIWTKVLGLSREE